MRCIATLNGHTYLVYGCAFSADGTILVSASRDKSVRLWNMKTFKNMATLRARKQGFKGCDISRDGILAAVSGKNIPLWDVNTKQNIAVLKGHTMWCYTCCFTADCTLLASTSHDGTVRLWDMRTRESIATLSSVGSITRQCSFSSDGAWIVAACSMEKVARVWDVKTFQCIATLQHDESVMSCSFSTNGMIATGNGLASKESAIHLWQ